MPGWGEIPQVQQQWHAGINLTRPLAMTVVMGLGRYASIIRARALAHIEKHNT